ncbi:hypothetical protein Aple_096320 [Acrocarpospora pleiomorpha]|uniref:DUF7144 domain-containing protein n=1 Tax=Acrocarpospora pleiomorpha TaxID=90975 RepID=A0A5M3Y3U9_9ACTN|nr:hypothetical protein [Acrocarpospora pleiomorpha]GES26733.1 hypothetical protein Aple_096320 [Acrocarpospora pleiomorpha]
MTTASPGRMPSTRSNWLGFAGIIGITVGLFNIIGGLVALFRSSYYSHILLWNFTAWGVIWLIIGILQLAAGFGILAGKMWARTLGIIMAGLAMLGQFAFAAAFPLWSIISIALSLFVIYALVVPPRGSVA